MGAMKKIAIGLFAIQIMALIGRLIGNGGLGFSASNATDIAEIIGYFSPAIAGIILFAISGNTKK